jgi:GNAT superfamily N-acetyltransferase
MAYRRTGRRDPPPGVSRSEMNKRELKALVDRGVVPGLLAYEDGRPVGWVSLGPREDYARLEKSIVMKPVDDEPVWSIICFFVDAKARHRGVADALLDAALDWARDQGVKLIEAYPCDKPAGARDDDLWFGTPAMFERRGFAEIARRKPTRPFMRKTLRASRSRANER